MTFMKFIIRPIKRLLVVGILLPFIIGCWILPRKLSNHVLCGFFSIIGRTFGDDSIARRNLDMAFPHMQPTEKEIIIRNMWGFMGRVLGDLITLPRWRVGRDIQVRNEQYYLDALAHNKGVVVVTAHLGSWEISSAVIGHYRDDIMGVYSRLKNPILDRLVYEWRARITPYLMEKDDDRTPLRMMRGLRQNKTVIMISDQKFAKGEYIPFFGIPALSPMGAGVFATKGIPVVPLQIVRGADGVSFDCIFHPPVSIPNTGDNDADAKAIVADLNAQFANWISQNPDQYPWVHQRWDDKYYTISDDQGGHA